jgi:hypothetical protein
MKHFPNSSFEKWWREEWGLNRVKIVHKVKNVLYVLGVFLETEDCKGRILCIWVNMVMKSTTHNNGDHMFFNLHI